MHLTFVHDSSQHVALFLAGVSVIRQTLQVSEAGPPLGTGRAFAGLVLHVGLLALSPAWARPAMEFTFCLISWSKSFVSYLLYLVHFFSVFCKPN